MKIKKCPQRSLRKIGYKFNGEIITVTLDETQDVFNFTQLPNGKLQSVETHLPINPIISAKRENGDLSVVLLSFVGENATQEELFPQWQVID